MLQNLPAEATYRLHGHICGRESSWWLWQATGRAVESGWTSARQEHHDRLLNLLGHKAGSEPAGSSRRAGGHRPGRRRPRARPGRPAWNEAAVAVARARSRCCWPTTGPGGFAPEAVGGDRGPVAAPRLLRRAGGGVPRDAREVRGLRGAEAAADGPGDGGDVEGGVLHRCRIARSALKWALRQLVAAEKSGIDLIDDPEPESGPPAAPEAVSEAVAAAPSAPSRPGKNDITVESQNTSEEVASVGDRPRSRGRPEAPAGSPGRPGGDRCDPGPESPPNRR